MHSGSDLPLSETQHFHPRLHRKLTTVRISVYPVNNRRESLIMNREGGRNTYPPALVFLLFGEGAPFRTSTHQILGKYKAAVLANSLSLIKVLNQIDATAFWTNMDP
jgi:hypothetical protein